MAVDFLENGRDEPKSLGNPACAFAILLFFSRGQRGRRGESTTTKIRFVYLYFRRKKGGRSVGHETSFLLLELRGFLL